MNRIKICAVLLSAMIFLTSSNVCIFASAESEAADAEVFLSDKTDTPCDAPYPSSASSNTVRYVWSIKPSVAADDMKAFFNYNGSGRLDMMNMVDCIPFEKNGKWGLVDYKGSVVYNAVFDDIQTNAQGVMVGVDEKNFSNFKTLIYSNGKITTKDYQFELGTNGRSLRDYYWDDSSKKLYLQNGAAPAEPITTNTLIAAQLGEKSYVSNGNILIMGSPNGLAFNENAPDIVLIANNKRINNKKYVDGGCSSDGLIAVREKDKWGYVNASGKTVIPFSYDSTSILSYHPKNVFRPMAYEFTNGYVSVCKNGKYSLLDTKGNVVIPEGEFQKILPVYYTNGQKLAWVKSNGKWGIIRVSDRPIDLTYDIDGDGEVTAADSLLVLRISVKLVKQTAKADVDKDGIVTSADALIVLRRSVGINK